MKQLRALFLIFFFCGIAVAVRAEDEVPWKIVPKTDEGFIEYDLNTGVGTTTNGVIITYSNIVLTADSVVADPNTGEVQAEGNVTINSHGALWSGKRIIYNFKTEQMVSDNFKLGQSPFFIQGEGLTGNHTNQTYSTTNVLVTTDDYAEPAYKIRARKLTIVPNKYFEAESATLRIGNVPIFYFPYYRRNLGQRVNHFDFTPGYRTVYGPYLLTTYNWYTKEKLDGAIHMDYREKRGFGTGPDLGYHLGKFGEGKIQYYYAHDNDPNADNVQTNSIPSERHRINFSHQMTLQTNLTLKAAANYQSDSLVDHDFFENEYRRDTQPKTFVEVNQNWPNFDLNLLAQPQVNDFQETVERLPDIKLSALRQQLGNTPLYYEGENTVGYYERAFVDNSTNFSAGRFDSFHQILLPQTFFGWLNFTPRVGGRFTYYTETDGLTNGPSAQTRGVFNTGAEITFKTSRVWAGIKNKLLDLNGVRHILEPLVNYAYVPRPNVRPYSSTDMELPQFDYELASLRTLPIDFPEYNAIDSIDSQNVVRFGMRNRLQTKRENIVDNLLSWSLFTDWRINPGIDPTSGTNLTKQTTFAPLTSSLEFKPRSWITFQSDTRYDLNGSGFLEADQRLTLEPNNIWSTSLGYRYLDNNPLNGSGPGHNLITTSLYYRLNENWAARMSHHFEAQDGIMEEQYYTLYRDLRSWTAALTFRVRDNRSGPDDYTVAVTFSLKAFPRFGLNSDRDKPALLVGY